MNNSVQAGRFPHLGHGISHTLIVFCLSSLFFLNCVSTRVTSLLKKNKFPEAAPDFLATHRRKCSLPGPLEQQLFIPRITRQQIPRGHDEWETPVCQGRASTVESCLNAKAVNKSNFLIKFLMAVKG